jgi:uncharacterized membrane protein
MTKTKITLLISFLFFGLFLFSVSFANAEVIRNFDSQIKINSDSSILITETINYDFATAEKHGIYRDIPVNYKTTLGNKSVSLEMQSVTKDGIDESYAISKIGSNKSIKIGELQTLVSGEHIYVITYKIIGAINYFKDLDELYWNVTGNGWVVPIENVSASIELPNSIINNKSISCYEGILGSTEKCITENNINQTNVKSSRVLISGEGLTIALDFPKGIVKEPTKTEIIMSLIKDNIILILPFFVFIIMFYIWRKYGKDPKGYTTIIAQYEAPNGMKPTLVGSLVDERPDYRDVTAGLIYLAEQGFLKIKRLEKEGLLGSVDYEIELLKINMESLEKTEKSILNLFFGNTLTIGSTEKISNFKKDISFSIKVKKIISDLYQEMTDRGFFVSNPMKAKIPYIIIGSIFIFLGVFLFSKIIGVIGIVSVVISGIIIIIFGGLMSKKTKLGAETKDYILGFKEFLSVTEKDRLAFHNAPEKNPEQFMEFLPYAIALKVENKWAKQFEGIYISEPSWYQGNMTGAFVATSFVSHMSDFSQSVDTSLSIISNGAASGGFGGGGSGFSGGGFGGGGGGSW